MNKVRTFMAAFSKAALPQALPEAPAVPIMQSKMVVKNKLLLPANAERNFASCHSMRLCAALFLALCILAPNIGHAQLIGTDKTYDENLRGARSIAALDETLFGDKISLQDGRVFFEQNDVVLATNSELEVLLSRKTPAGSRGRDQAFSSQGLDREFAVFGIGWELNVPYMMGTYDMQDGWNVNVRNNASSNRCSTGDFAPFERQPSILPYEADPLVAHMYWKGVQINIPGQGEEQLLILNPGQVLPADGRTYVGTTKASWRVSCITKIKNGYGEGFAVVLPNGTRYYFDWMAVRDAVDLTMNGTTDNNGDYWDPGDLLAELVDVFLYATRVEDRFGNFVSYTYDSDHPNRIKSIESNDGVRLDVEYNPSGQIYRVKSGSRYWTYGYETIAADNGFRRLSSIELPDGSKWGFSFQPRTAVTLERNFWKNCAEDPGLMTSDAPLDPTRLKTMTMTHPSGAKGEFRFLRLFHGTNNTPGECHSFVGGGQWGTISWGTTGVPSAYAEDSLYEKKISGPGIPSRIWNYKYYPSWSFAYDCNTPCATTSQTIVQTNDGVLRRYTFGNDFSLNVGQLLAETTEKGGVVLQAKSYMYLSSADGQPFSDRAGIISFGGGDGFNYGNPLMFKNRPLRVTTTLQDGVSFSRVVNTFDAFVRPRSVTVGSSAN